MWRCGAAVLSALPLWLCLLSVVDLTSANEVLGCGGFARVSDALKATVKGKVDFSSVSVKMYSADGSVLKHSTECAPNGYYFIPVYDRGTFSLHVEGPQGWAFQPKEVSVVVGADGQCAGGKDVNFEFTGFKLAGSVMSSPACSPSVGVGGVTVTLTHSESKTVLTTTSDSKGDYAFDNVFPSAYEVSGSHPVWTLAKSRVAVTLAWDNLRVTEALLVAGFDVRASILSGSEPVSAVDFLLFATKGATPPPCAKGSKAPVGFVAPAELASEAFCSAVSSASGTVTFTDVPCGSYTLVPFYKSELTKFDVAPGSAPVVVSHGTATVAQPFSVLGFSVSGRVVNGDSGVSGAAVLLNGVAKATTGPDGSYTIDHVTSGTYDVEARKDHIVFKAVTDVKVSPGSPRLPHVSASAFALCGKLHAEAAAALRRDVTLTSAATGRVVDRKAADASGSFCLEGGPGSYTVAVVALPSDPDAGLLYMPSSLPVTVTSGPVMGLDFAQARVKVSGRVVAHSESSLSGAGVTVTLAHSGGRGSETANVGADGTFSFSSVVPGPYKASVHKSEWCWEAEEVDVSVGATDRTDVVFTQKGTLLTTSATHELSIEVALETSPADVSTLPVSKGSDSFCLKKAGSYRLTPKGCFVFSPPHQTFSTAAPSPVSFVPNAARVSGHLEVKTSKGAKAAGNEVTVTILRNGDGAAAEVLSVTSREGSDPSITLLEYSFVVGEGESVTVRPSSPSLLFSPREASLTFPRGFSSGCPGPVPVFTSRLGVFLSGRIVPPVEGAVVSAVSGSDTVATATTDASGAYRLGPLYDDVTYTTQAAADGYALSATGEGNFAAKRLGGFTVNVADQASNKAVSGVLLSVSGDGYRSNNATGEGGSLTFTNLLPGEYYVRPTLKEYVFTPTTKTVEVAEGPVVAIAFAATRVAFSASGRVRGLDGAGEGGVTVEAVGPGGEREDAVTDNGGHFRVRGLKPGLEYSVRVRAGASSVGATIERASPSQVVVLMAAEDVSGLEFVSFRAPIKMDIRGRVALSDSTLATSLTVHLKSSDGSAEPLSVPLSPAAVFAFPHLSRGSYVVSLTSTLSTFDYEYKLESTTVHGADVPADGQALVELSFSPRLKFVEEEISSTSFVGLSLVLLAAYGAVNHVTVLYLFERYWNGKLPSKGTAGGRPDSWAVDAARSTSQRRR